MNSISSRLCGFISALVLTGLTACGGGGGGEGGVPPPTITGASFANCSEERVFSSEPCLLRIWTVNRSDQVDVVQNMDCDGMTATTDPEPWGNHEIKWRLALTSLQPDRAPDYLTFYAYTIEYVSQDGGPAIPSVYRVPVGNQRVELIKPGGICCTVYGVTLPLFTTAQKDAYPYPGAVRTYDAWFTWGLRTPSGKGYKISRYVTILLDDFNNCGGSAPPPIPPPIDPPIDPFGLLATDVDSFFYQIDPSSGTSTLISNTLEGFDSIPGLAFDPTTDTLYGVRQTSFSSDQLITIDPATGADTLVGVTGIFDVQTLAFDPNTNTLYTTTTGPTAQLFRIDPATGIGTVVGLSGFFSVGGLAFDPNTNTLYGTTIGLTAELITIDPVTGAGTAVGPLGFDNVAGLAFDPNTNTLYGTDFFTQLLTIDPATGAGTAVGSTGNAMQGLASR